MVDAPRVRHRRHLRDSSTTTTHRLAFNHLTCRQRQRLRHRRALNGHLATLHVAVRWRVRSAARRGSFGATGSSACIS
jgi:hypothetical protein